MSSLEKLMIRGIRSYNPNTSNTIYFSSPLTLIVGQNGTGKTTIIEALKFITTNDLPQNTRGGAFIYHPKLLHQVDVKAQVKLKFRNIENVEMVCTRSLQATNKKSGLTQKSIESTLLYKNSNVSISNKCVNIENEIQHHLGVSSAILQNVIFCHQEESNWILSEPGNVKKRLDDIFATSKYSKALDCIKTLKKETSGSLKSKMQELDYLNEKKVKKEKLEAQIMEYNEKSSFILKQIEECEDLQLDEKIVLLKQELKNNEENEKERMKIEIEIENLLKCKYEINNEFSKDELNEKLQIYKKNKNDSFTLLNDMTNKDNFSDFSINSQQDKIKNNDLSDSINNDKKFSKQGFFHCFSDNIPYGEYNFGKFTTDYENKILLLQEKEKKLDNQNDFYINNKYDLSMQKNEIENLLSKQEINNAKIFEIENIYLKDFDIKRENETCYYLKSLENELHNLKNNNNLVNFSDECNKLTEKINLDQEKLNISKVEEKNINFIIFESNKTICDIEKRILDSQNFKFEDVDNLYQKEIELEENCEEKEIELNSVYKNQEKIFEMRNLKSQKLQCKQDIENSKQEIVKFFEKQKN
ncbi:DNA repair protein rad50 [Gurleya vavrai]